MAGTGGELPSGVRMFDRAGCGFMAVVGAWGLGWCLGPWGAHGHKVGTGFGMTSFSNGVQEEGVRRDGGVGL